MTLKEYIERHGDEACARAWGFAPRTIASWRRGERIPVVESARTILGNCSHELTWASIYGEPAPSSEAAS